MSFSHPVILLSFVTFLLVVAFLVWNLMSVKKNQATGGKTSGIGGQNDPLSGASLEKAEFKDLPPGVRQREQS